MSSEIERHTIYQIPEEARHGRARDLFSVWFSTNMTLLTVVTGSLGPAVFHLSFTWSVLALLLGSLAGGVFMALHAAQGPALGVPQMIQSRGQFGAWGAIPIVAMVIIMYVGFVAANCVVGAEALRYAVPLAGQHMTVILMALLSLVPCIVGYRLIHLCSPPVTVITVIATILCGWQVLHGHMFAILSDLHGSYSGFFQAFAIAVLWQISYAPYVSDSSRYLPARPETYRDTFIACYAGSVLGSALAMGLGALLASQVAGLPMVNVIGQNSGSFGVAIVLVLALSISLANAMDLYCCTLSTITLLQTFLPRWKAAARERILTSIAILIVAIGMALFMSKGFLDSYAALLDVLMAVMVPWTAINLIDFYWLRHGTYDVASFFRPDGGIYGRVNHAAMLSYGIGILAEIPFLDLKFYRGFMVDRLQSVDISWLMSLAAASISYMLLQRLPISGRSQRAIQKPHDESAPVPASDQRGRICLRMTTLPPGPPDRSEHQARNASTTLRDRHVTMITFGGMIGGSLFIGSSTVIARAGPGALASYFITGMIILFVTRMLAEMTVASPQSGTFVGQIRRGLGNRTAFIAGWIYWIMWSAVIAMEAIAIATVLTPYLSTPPLLTELLAICGMTAANLVSVRGYGEFEFWFSLLKIMTIVTFILIGTSSLLGFFHPVTHSEGALALSAGSLIPHGASALFAVIPVIMMSMAGTEIATIAAVETDDPARSMARSTRSIVVRIMLFYLLSIGLIIALLPLSRIVPGQSPFLATLNYINIPFAAAMMTGTLCIATLSALNSGIYITSRILCELATEGDAPGFLLRRDRKGTPVNAILCGSTVSITITLLGAIWPGRAFSFLISAFGNFILYDYALIIIAHLTLRHAAHRAGQKLALPMWGFPVLSHLTLVGIVAALVTMLFLNDHTRQEVIFSTIGLILIVLAERLTRRFRKPRNAMHDPEPAAAVKSA